ncbi:ABC transporter ATP-binding protein [Candidatus Williamhamiltonella defendens]|uniref:ATP-binding protein Uup n=1 Tax=Candidatus Williamhamiltonella defendens TaxID=138072 RepID=A0A2D3T780_9ENTR|nr:ABC transporter ATP-binding protein [Candidatus Hamiltonella defensa]ATW29572.1 ABC transporter ATP-binding protein [Candidatus Hamiltonella defensa]ATW31553.1 ABC transporter ATP-binding protein [Candidatus Hamiltonella defensa]
MSLISLSGAYLSFSDAPLLDHTQLHVEPNERVCLVGRNGTGKSTLLKILNKEMSLDDGQIVYQQDLVVARLQQDPPREVEGTVFDFISEGVKEQAAHLKTYQDILNKIETDPSEKNLEQLATLQNILDHQDLWQLEARIHDVLKQLGLSAEQKLSSLSGGWLRKAALGRALVSAPEVLLLDEPTNHLDIQSIQWLEEFLKNFEGSLVFISHDRSFISAIATRIVDLDRGKLTSWPGNYALYLEKKEDALRVEELQNAEFDRKLAQEEIWIRQGIKARRTRNEGRVRALKSLRQQRSERREVMGKAKIQWEEQKRSGKMVFELENVSYTLSNKILVDDFSVQVLRGDKIALVGPNGCGKTTLLKLMLGELKAQSGKIYRGTHLDVAYFDQHRAELDPQKTVLDNLAEGKQEVMINGRSRHVLGYLQDFLFHPKRAMTPVKVLSGGERHRLLLAKLFLKPSNLLILDEPTNDLDIETLELLEEMIEAYQGTVLLVSHDRQFVDNAVTECWIFEGDGQINRFIGGYSDAHQQRSASKSMHQKIEAPPSPLPIQKQRGTPGSSKTHQTSVHKLSYQQKKELEQLPMELEALEEKIALLQSEVSTPDFFSKPQNETQQKLNTLRDSERALEEAFARWAYLEAFEKK